MSETVGTPYQSTTGPDSETVHEAYSFACMNCGAGWEESYDIAHHTDEHGHLSVVYYTAGHQRVPSPLTRPNCTNCGGHLVRIMRSGRVSSARWEHSAHSSPPPRGHSSAAVPILMADRDEGDEDGSSSTTAREPKARHEHHWLADLLAFLHLGHREGDEHHRAA
ncbi:hypothetical protein K7472_23015 [Streptomyces sp. PTM05]|uniref:C2H2-type domain-containing protein n=1 Tax=Streptantibioticus parmotrematis TaxID=2873249 RepID=A0ABS7QXP5_9ACTN|nr:hypothetical protein [Streptantibioticus parmotrematis]MBY8887688.1 hypothetical protein [Streptantibioticus parmotrematis]